MAIEEKRTMHQQYGALLVAVGHVMLSKNVSAQAAKSGAFDHIILEELIVAGYDEENAQVLLEIDLSEAINMQ